MDETPETTQPPLQPESQGPKAPGPIQALGQIFFSPGALFASMAKSGWGMAFMALALTGLLVGLVTMIFMKRVDQEAFIRDQLRHSRFASQMTDDMIDKQAESAKDANPWLRAALSCAVYPVWLFLVALLYWLVFLAMGAELKYPKALLATVWCQAPMWVQSLLACVILWFKDPETLDPTNPVLSNFGAILGREDLAPAVHAALSSLDLFEIWKVILYAVAFSALGKVGKGTALAVVVGVFLLKVLLKSGFALVMVV